MSQAKGQQTSTKPAALAAAAGLAATSALWALFQWTELRVARSGGDSFCGFGGGDTCARIWDSPLASTVQELTGVPVAGWGLVWSLAALAFPVLALTRLAGGREAGAAAAATGWVGLGGALTVMGLAVGLVLEGALCTTCLVTHGLVLAYAATVLAGGVRLAPRGPGLAMAGAGVLAAFALLLVPGLRTPPATSKLAPLALPAVPAGPTGAGDALGLFIGQLPPELRQALADSLAMHRSSPERPTRPARFLVGDPEAPVRITEFADTKCGHCAALHRSLSEIRRGTPEGSFSVEPRQFPLDGRCNPHISRDSEDGIRCLAARAQICAEGQAEAFAFSGALFEDQAELDEASIQAAARRHLPELDLEGCLAAEDTERRLQEDIAWAMEHRIRGTPLVLVNGRETPAFAPLLYALVLAEGDASHPSFDALPAPRSDPHAGHDH